MSSSIQKLRSKISGNLWIPRTDSNHEAQKRYWRGYIEALYWEARFITKRDYTELMRLIAQY